MSCDPYLDGPRLNHSSTLDFSSSFGVKAIVKNPRFWILTFSWASNIPYDTASWRWQMPHNHEGEQPTRGQSQSVPRQPCCFSLSIQYLKGEGVLPWWLRQYRICLQSRRPGFNPWIGKILWRREWLPTQVFLPGEFHEQRNLAGYKQFLGSQRVRHNWVN